MTVGNLQEREACLGSLYVSGLCCPYGLYAHRDVLNLSFHAPRRFGGWVNVAFLYSLWCLELLFLAQCSFIMYPFWLFGYIYHLLCSQNAVFGYIYFSISASNSSMLGNVSLKFSGRICMPSYAVMAIGWL